jgi:hypothetical protein
LPSLSAYYSDNTATGTDYDSGGTQTDETTTNAEKPGGVTTPGDTTGANGNYDPDLYAPGAGQEPLPGPGDGGDQGGAGDPGAAGGGGGAAPPPGRPVH